MATSKPSALEHMRPTLLVGIGGTGCQIVDQVYGMAEEAQLNNIGRISMLGFDTDENDLARHKHLSAKQLIRTSTADTVFQILYKKNELVEGWFAEEQDISTEIRQMNLLDGAGQIRMLSRLAFAAALEDPQISTKIDNAISAIATHDNEQPFEGHVNVMITCSLAGGTGSGMFLQTAFLLAEHLRRKGIEPTIRGLFLLPDIFVKAARLPIQQIPNVLANGYAALRELNALMLSTSGRTDKPVVFEYAKGKQLKMDEMPFKSVALLDYENQSGGNLGRNFPAYKAMAARAAYTMLFTPIGGREKSITINDVRARLAEASTGNVNYYAGVGMGAIVYPQNSILDYLGLRFGQHLLDGDWLLLDRRFREEQRRYHERVNNGERNLRPPRMADLFIRNLEMLAGEPKPPRLIAEVHEGVNRRVEDKSGSISIEMQHEKYLDNLTAHLRSAFWNSTPDLKSVKHTEELSVEALSDRDAVASEVQDLERELRIAREHIDEAVEKVPYELFSNIVLGADLLGPSEWTDYHLQQYILQGGAHLLQIRYFLYKTRQLVADRLEKLNPEKLRQSLNKLPSMFDDPSTEEIESALDVADTVAASRWPEFLDRKFPEFASNYREYYNKSLKTVKRYAETALVEKVYRMLEQRITEITTVIERFFGELEQLRDDLQLESNRLEGQHDNQGIADGNCYVFASTEAKQRLWEEFSNRFDDGGVGKEINQALTGALYQRFLEEQQHDRWKVVKPFSGRDLFRRQVVDGYCRDTLQQNYASLYQMPVIEAVRREAILEDKDWIEHMRQLVELVSYQSQPYTALSDPHDGQRIMFWGISPNNKRAVTDEQTFLDLFTRNQGETPLVEEEFFDHTLLCFNSRVNLTLQALRKLHPGLAGAEDSIANNVSAPTQGRYYSAYKIINDEILADKQAKPDVPSTHFTLHIDKEWHKPGVLPDIFPMEADQHKADILTAFVMGIALDQLPQETHGRSKVTMFHSWTKRGTPAASESLLNDHDDIALLELLPTRPDVINDIRLRYDRLNQNFVDSRGRHTDDPNKNILYREMLHPDVMERLMMLLSKPSDSAATLATQALERFFNLAYQYVDQHMYMLGQQERHEKVRRRLERQIKQASASVLERSQEISEQAAQQAASMADGVLSRIAEQHMANY